MRQAIALIRVSTDSQAADDRAGLASQRRECQRIAEREGLAIVEWIELAGVSGAKVLQDRRFVAMLDRIARREFAAVVASAWDRIMRPADARDYLILDVLRDSGTLVYTGAGVRDVRSDRLLTVLESEIANIEKEHIRRRTMAGKAEFRRQGRHVAGPEGLPYAVAFDRESGAWSYRPAEASVVREVFDRVLAGERNFSALARGLGIGRTLVQKILRQPLYAGFRRIGSDGRVTLADGEEQVVIDSPLVPREEWERAQRVAAGRAPTPRGRGPGIYRGFVRCAGCGAAMHVHRDRVGWGYRCRSGRHVQIVVPAVDAACDLALAGRLAQPDVLLAALAGVLETRAAARPDVEALAAEVKRLVAERERVAVAFERGLRGLADAERRTREIDAALVRLAREPEPGPGPESIEALAATLAAPFAEWPYLSAAQKRRILAPSVEWLRIERTGRAQAAVRAVRLRIPTDPSPTTPIGPRRATWRVWGDSLEVTLQ